VYSDEAALDTHRKQATSDALKKAGLVQSMTLTFGDVCSRMVAGRQR
jgi:hypothetical protein